MSRTIFASQWVTDLFKGKKYIKDMEHMYKTSEVRFGEDKDSIGKLIPNFIIGPKHSVILARSKRLADLPTERKSVMKKEFESTNQVIDAENDILLQSIVTQL